MTKYINIAVLCGFVVLSVFVAVGAITLLHQPIILDYFYNPTLKMYEPVEISLPSGVWNLLLTPVALLTYLVCRPIWFQALYISLALWLLIIHFWPRILGDFHTRDSVNSTM